MRRALLTAALVLVALALVISPMCAAPAFAQGAQGAGLAGAGRGPGDPAALALQVLEIFTTHCAECHAATLPKPKGRFGYVTDLRRLVSDHQVEPGQSGESELYKLIVTKDPEYIMPPPKAKAGPLSAEQIITVKAWIDAGALPPPEDATAGAPARGGAGAAGGARSAAKPAALPMPDRVLAFGGKFHPVVVHFPIALLMVAALGEVLAILGFGPGREAGRLLVPLAAVAAVAAVVLGLLSATYGGYGAGVFVHRLLGIITGVLAVATAVLQQVHLRRPGPGTLLAYRLCLLASAGLVGLTGHFGGILVYGEDHFEF